jgi:hypothetical protein
MGRNKMETNEFKKGKKVRFELNCSQDEWDMSDEEFEILQEHDGEIATISSDLVCEEAYYDLVFEDGYKIEAADLYGLEVVD